MVQQAPKKKTRRTRTKHDENKSAIEIVARNERQQDYIKALHESPQVIVFGHAGTGKTYIVSSFAANEYHLKHINKIVITRPHVAVGKDIGYLPGPQPLYSKVLTPEGWKEIGKLSVGDSVIGSQGKPVVVTGVYPQGIKAVYKVFTSDGRVASSSDDHLWYTTTWEQNKRKKPGSVKTLSEIMKTLKTGNGQLNHYLPTVPAVEFSVKNSLPIPAYTLGCLLGDGSFGESICLANKEEDYEIRERCAQEVYEFFGLSMKSQGALHYFCGEYPSNKKSCVERSLTGRWTNPLKQAVDNLHLLKVTGPHKFIPDIYKTASIEDRLEILRGLMDTDGSVKKNGEAVFHTSSPDLAADVQELVWSLGGNATIRDRGLREETFYFGRSIKANHNSYDVNISLLNTNPFYLNRKAERYSKRYLHTPKIKNIEFVGEQECVCISVDSEDHLYVTNSYILTHNTLEEKCAPWALPVIDVLEGHLGKGVVETALKNGNIEVAPLALMRGRSFEKSFVICDEAQNITLQELKMLVTRIGEGSQLVLNGDVQQSDLNDQSGLSKIVHLTKKHMLPIPVIEFGVEDIVRSDICKTWIKTFAKEGI